VSDVNERTREKFVADCCINIAQSGNNTFFVVLAERAETVF
jgi:hypothetical protein